MSQPSHVEFHTDTLRRVGANGDNWCMTWAADDSKVTSMDDGGWLDGKRSYSNHLYRIVGDKDAFTRHDQPGYPHFAYGGGGWFGYGICSVDGVLYSLVSKCPEDSWSGPFQGIKLLASRDGGETWY